MVVSSAAKLGATMSIGELFSFREWNDTAWSKTQNAEAFRSSSSLLQRNVLKLANVVKLRLVKCAHHAL